MSEIVKFFWSRWRRAVQMDMANKINNQPTYFWITANEWVDAYKATLSKNKQADFDKEWAKLETQLSEFQDGKKGAINPLGLN